MQNCTMEIEKENLPFLNNLFHQISSFYEKSERKNPFTLDVHEGKVYYYKDESLILFDEEGNLL